jgi:uncharacterized protein YceK
MWPNHTLQRTRLSCSSCIRDVPCACSLSLGRQAAPVVMQTLIRAAALILLMVLTGCCTMAAHSDSGPGVPGPYAGVRGYAVYVAHSADMNLKEFPGQILLYFDLPFSFVLDTLLLPLDITETYREAHDHKPSNKDDKPPDKSPEQTAFHADSSAARSPPCAGGGSARLLDRRRNQNLLCLTGSARWPQEGNSRWMLRQNCRNEASSSFPDPCGPICWPTHIAPPWHRRPATTSGSAAPRRR